MARNVKIFVAYQAVTASENRAIWRVKRKIRRKMAENIGVSDIMVKKRRQMASASA